MSGATNFVTLDPPPAREPQRLVEGMTVREQRVVVLQPEGYVRDVRAASDPYRNPDGDLVIDLITEAAYYEARLHGTRAARQTYPAYLVYAE